jgi:hypothetical protein
MSKLRDHLSTLSLTDGGTVTTDCPVCGGQKKFTASKVNGLTLYNCYRLGCGVRGATSDGRTADDIKKLLTNFRGMPSAQVKVVEAMVLPITLSYDLSDERLQRFIHRWKLHEVPMMYDIAEERAVFLIHDNIGRLIDAVGRSLNGSIPKWRRYSNAANYYYYGHTNVAIVVEDVISACVSNRATSYAATGVAILGTSLAAEHIEYLKQFDKVIVALDPDASHKTIQYTRLLSNYIDNVSALMLHDDIKYEVADDIHKLKELVHADTRNT